MDLRSGQPFWLIRNGLITTFPALDEDITCEVLIVGGGITGALVGHHLTEAGISAIVLDQRDIGWGSTAASTALLQYEIDTPLHELAEKVGLHHAERCYHACRDAIDKVGDLASIFDDHTGFAHRPSVFIARKQADVKKIRLEFEARKAAGFKVRWWDEAALRDHLGFTRPCAIWSKDGGQVDAYRLAYQLLRRAVRRGLRVHDRTAVEHYEVRRGRVIARTDRGHTVRARHIVFASGYESQNILREKIVTLHSSFAMVSEPVEPALLWERRSLIWECGDAYLYLRTTDDHRILIGGEDEPFRDPDKRDTLIPAKSRLLLHKFQKLFPDIPFEIAFAWAGTFGETKDGLPYIGPHPGFPSAFFTLGFGGNGITYSALGAEIIRDNILKKPNPYRDLFPFSR